VSYGHVQTMVHSLQSAYRDGYSLPQMAYSNSAIYKAELDAIFHHDWVFAGHASQIPKAGDYFLCEFDCESVIITRTHEGNIRAHMNVCRHRGSRICLETAGHKTLFTCPYHAWSYDLAGNLVAARMMPDDFDPANNGLQFVQIEDIHGLLFISLSQNPPSINKVKTNIAEVAAKFGFNHLKIVKHKTYDIPANWKLALENYQECYHCQPSHPEYANIHAMTLSREEFQQRRKDFLMEHTGVIAQTDINKYFDLADDGTTSFQYCRNPLHDTIKSGSKNGQSVAPLLGQLTDFDGGASELMIGPINFFLIYSDHMLGYRFLPTSLESCKCDIYWFVRNDAKEGLDYNLEDLTWLWDVTTQADKKIITHNQQGVNSAFYSPGRLSQMEFFEQSFLNWYIETLGKSVKADQ